MRAGLPPALTGRARPTGRRRHTCDVDTGDLFPSAGSLLAAGYRLALVAGHDDGDNLRVVYLFTAGAAAGVAEHRLELQVRVPREDPRIPSLAGLSFPASRFERELQDTFGITPVGHPQPTRLVHHQHWPADWYPMRRGAGPAPAFQDEGQPYPFLAVEGEGVYEIPVGPVHAGVIEPGHFRFSVIGETILAMRARLWFVHKGVERLFQERTALEGVALAERISGDSAVGHSLAYCLAVEDACGIAVPQQAQALRAVLLEMERLYNHTGDLGALCNDVGYGVVHSHALRLRERLLRMNATVAGHRLLRGCIVPGGTVVRSLPDLAALEEVGAAVQELADTALTNRTVMDRFTGTAVLPAHQAAGLGVLGYVGRASGQLVDARVDHPFVEGASPNVSPRQTVCTEGDVLARFRVRVGDVAASTVRLRALLATAAAALGHPEPAGSRPAVTTGVGIVEGWRGTLVHRVEIGPGLIVQRVKVVDPSFFNWPALAVALQDSIVPDFPLANKSFNLSYAGNDL